MKPKMTTHPATAPEPKPAQNRPDTAQWEAMAREYLKKWQLETWEYGNAPAPSRQHHYIHLWLANEFKRLLKEGA